MRNLIGYTTILLFFFACSGNRKQLLSEEKFAEVLADMHVYDAIIDNQQLKQSELRTIDSAYIYSALFEKHDVTKEQFDSSLFYYSQHPRELLKITENVYSILEKRAELEKQATKELMNFERFWNSDGIQFINGHVGPEKEIYTIPLDTTGIFRLEVTLRFQENDKSLRPYLLGYFAKDTTENSDKIYFPKIPVFKTKYTREYVLSNELQDTNYKYIILHALECENTDSTFYRNFSVVKIEASLVTTGDDLDKKQDKSALKDAKKNINRMPN